MKIPLNKNTIGSSEKKALNKVLNSTIESDFAKFIGSKHAIMLVPQQIFWPFLQFLITIN